MKKAGIRRLFSWQAQAQGQEVERGVFVTTVL